MESNKLYKDNNKELNLPINIQMNDKQDVCCQDFQSHSRTITCQSSTIQENTSISYEHNQNKKSFKYLEKYKDIYVPKIFLLDYNDITNYPPKIDQDEMNQNLKLNNFPIFNIQNNNNINTSYLNYGYNFQQWKIYANDIRNKFDELNDLVKNGKIKLPDPSNELEYIMSFPSDYGGLGYLYNEHKYENVKFYDPKKPENKDSNFMAQIKFEKKMTWFPLNPNPETLIKKSYPYYFMGMYYDFYANNINKFNNNCISIIKNNNNILNTKDEAKSNGNIDKKEENENIDYNYDKKVEEADNKKKEEDKDDYDDEYISKTRERSRSRNRSRSRSRSKYNNINKNKNRYSNKYKFKYNYNKFKDNIYNKYKNKTKKYFKKYY